MTVIIFIAILALLILIHEAGHLLVAKWSGVRVDEFGIGFPPRLWSWRRGETTYAINLLPFGGYVKIFGENPEIKPATEAERSRHLTEKPRWIQALILFGGVGFNWLLAWLILVLGLATVGLPTLLDEAPRAGVVRGAETVVLSVAPDSPAAHAALAPDDRIEALIADNEEIVKPSVAEMQAFIAARAGQEFTLEYRRGSEIRRSPLIPVLGLGEDPDQAVIGVGLAAAGQWHLPPLPALVEGSRSAVSMTALTLQGFGEIGRRLGGRITGRSEAPVLEAVTGPVGLVGLIGRASDLGFSYLILLTALISINLAILNLVPFPALDGGRLLFLLIEAVTRRPIKPAVANALNVAGFSLLILLMLVITISDIAKL